MKTVLTKILALGSIVLFILSGCKKGDVIVTSNGGKAGTLTATSTTLVLQSARITDTTKVITFSFTQANYGFSAAITNTLQIDKPGDNWVSPASATLSTNVLTQGYNTNDFNNLLLKLGLAGGTASSVNVRIVQSVSNSVTPVYSNVLALTVTPFNLKSWLYVVGAYQGWTLATADSLFSATSNGIYIGIINFATGNNQFLILPQKTNYNNKYATNDPSTQVPNSTVAVGANNNLAAPAALGQYLVTLNLNTNTITYALADYYSVIGDAAQGWGTDIAMKYVNDGNQNWVVTLPLVSTGAFKVRQDDAWSQSWGVPVSGQAGFGVANTLNNLNGNNNITIAVSGNYLVTFNAPPTTFGTPIGTGAGNNPIATTTYSAVKQ